MNPGELLSKVRYKRAWAALLGLLVCVFVIWTLIGVFTGPKNPTTHSAPPPSVAKQPLIPSSYQETRRLFGPWVLAAPGKTGAPHVVMLHANGGVDVAHAVVRVRRSWHVASAMELATVVSGNRTVRIRTTDGNIYNLKFNQAFIFASRPDTVYGFVRKAGKARLVSTTVSALKKRSSNH
ncbi:MAG TPA: hypothetical protein VF401_01990 [Candidatus Saccharimonadales bacterium]